MTPALRLRAGALGYRGAAPVLRELDFAVAAGERVALLGGNGAGKTTLLKACVGLLGGGGVALTVDGVAIASVAAAVGAGVGLVLQNPDDQLFGATVIEDVLAGPRNQGVAEDEARARAHAALERVGMTALAARPIERLSFGEKKRACLAGVLAMRPRVLLLDEPSAGLDPAGEAELVAYLDHLVVSERITLVCATHAIDLVPELAARVLVLGDERVLADGAARAILTDTDLLRRAGLRLPLIARLGQLAGCDPVPLTFTEAQATLTPIWTQTWTARQS